MIKSDEKITIKIDVDDGNATIKIKGLDDSLKSLQISGDQAGNSMKNFGNQTSEAKGSVEKATKTFKDSTIALHLNKAAALALETVKNSMDEAFSRLDAMENFERTLLRIYDGNQEMTDQVLSATDDMVRGTAYALDSVADHMKGFITLGNRTWEQATDDVAAWGDAVAFYGDGSSDQFDKVLRNLVSMSSKGTVRMEDLTDAVSAGIPVYDIYAAATGKSVEEVQRSFTTGQVSAEEFLDVMTTSFNEGIGDFVAIEGAAKEVGDSWSNTFSNFSTAVARGTTSIISDLDDAFGETRWGSIRDIISTSGILFESVLKTVGQVASTTVLFVDKYAEAILGVAVAYATWVVITNFQKAMEASTKAIQAATTVKQTYNALTMTHVTVQKIANDQLSLGTIMFGKLSKALTTSEVKTALHTKGTLALTAAKKALNPKAAAVAVVIGSIVAVTGYLIREFNKSSEEAGRLNGEFEELSESIDSNREATEESAKAFDENMRAIDANSVSVENQMDKIKELTEQEELSASEKVYLQHLIEQMNGSVEGLNLAYDEEANMLNMTTDEMKEKANAYLDTSTEIERVALSQERMNELSEEQIEIERQLEEVIALQREWAIAKEEGTVEGKEYDKAMKELDVTLLDLEEQLGDLGEEQLIVAGIIADSQEIIAESTEESAERQKLAYEDLNESQKTVIDSLKSDLTSYTEHASNRMSTLSDDIEVTGEDMIANMMENQRVMETWADNIATLAERGVDQGLLDELRRAGPESASEVAAMVQMSNDELDTMSELYGQSAEFATDTMKTAFGEGYGDAIDLAAGFVQETHTTMQQEIQDADFNSLGEDVIQGTIEGMKAQKKNAENQSKEVCEAVNETARDTYDTHSPSRVWRELGEFLIQGLDQGLNNNKSTVIRTAQTISNEVTKTMRRAFDINSPSRVMRDQIGKPIVEGVAVGIDSNSNLVDHSLNNLNSDMIRSAQTGSTDVVQGYDDMGQELERSLNRWPSFMRSALLSVNQILKIQTNISNRTIVQAVSEMTRSMNQLTPNFRSAGQSAMTGLNQGLLNGRAQVMNTARSIANQVASTMQNALKINSPSRVMRDDVGKWIPYGIAEGIDSHADKALNSTDDLGKQMIKLPNISAESILEGRFGRLGSPQTYSTSSTSNNHSVTNHYSYEGLMEGATIIWKGKEDIRQTMQEIAWITQREEARM